MPLHSLQRFFLGSFSGIRSTIFSPVGDGVLDLDGDPDLDADLDLEVDLDLDTDLDLEGDLDSVTVSDREVGRELEVEGLSSSSSETDITDESDML